MRHDEVLIDAIIVEDRARREYRNIDSLAGSIETLGLLHPPVVTPDLKLIAGGRRLEALKALEWERVPVRVADNLTETAELLQAESDENTEREPLTLSEAAALASKIEAVLKPLAAERQSPGINQHSEVGAKFAPSKEPKTREVAAKAAGVSHETIRKVRHVEEVIESDSTPEPVRDIAREALAEMNETGKADAGHKKVKAAVTATDLVEQFPDLAYYYDKGDHETVVRLGKALQACEEPELSMRINNLRLEVEMRKRRDSNPQPANNGPDWVKHADAIWVAFNNALQVFAKNGGIEAFEKAMPLADSMTIEMWRKNFTEILEKAEAISMVTAPKLRAVK